MGIRCCNCNENRKENEVIFPNNINYNIFGISNIFNKNVTSEFITINGNEKSLTSNSSLWNMDKRYDSIDNSSTDNKFYKYTSYAKSPYLEQIKEINQTEEDNSTQRKEEDKKEIEKYGNNKTENNLNKDNVKNNMDKNLNGNKNDFNNENNFEEGSIGKISSKDMKNQKKNLINKKRKIKLPKEDLKKNNK